jgi:DNA-binding CsgD family transcriptional regulator
MPYLRAGSVLVPLAAEVTTVGCGAGCGICLDDPSVSVLHAGLVRHGRYVYVASLGPPGGAVTVNGCPVTRRVLADGDVITFGQVACTAGGITAWTLSPPARRALPPVPSLSLRQREVVAALCQPARSGQPFAAPAQIAAALGISQAAVQKRLARLYRQFGVPAGPRRRVRLANLAVTLGLAQPAATLAAQLARQR